MADDKTYTESEHLAILADRVATETASLVAERDALKAERDELATKLDVETAAKAALEAKVQEVEKAHEDFVTGLEQLREAAERKDERLGQVKEVATHLGDEFLQDEKRIERIVAMSDTDFEGYIADLKATCPTETPVTVVPRESAMTGSPAGGTKTTTAARGFLLGRFDSTTKEG